MKIYGLCIFRLCTSWIKNNSDVHSVCVKTQALSGLNREVVCTRMSDQEEQSLWENCSFLLNYK